MSEMCKSLRTLSIVALAFGVAVLVLAALLLLRGSQLAAAPALLAVSGVCNLILGGLGRGVVLEPSRATRLLPAIVISLIVHAGAIGYCLLHGVTFVWLFAGAALGLGFAYVAHVVHREAHTA